MIQSNIKFKGVSYFKQISILLCLVLFICSGCSKKIYSGGNAKGTLRPYSVNGKVYRPISNAKGYTEEGIASWYGPRFHGKKTANGERYNMRDMTAAHRILPMHTKIRVTNINTGQTAILRINDRGPFANNRILDVSKAAAEKLGIIQKGTAHVKIEALNEDNTLNTQDTKQIMSSGSYYIQVGAFAEKANANSMLERLRVKGYTKSRLQKTEKNGATMWRVQAGTFESIDLAQQNLNELNAEFPVAFIIAK